MQARTPSSALPVPPSVAKMARAVLLSSGKGVVLRRFCRDYRELSFEVFPWRKLGYASAADMLQAMPAVVRFTFSQKDGDYKLYGVADKDVFNPSWFLKHEFKGDAQPRPRPRALRPAGSARALSYHVRIVLRCCLGNNAGGGAFGAVTSLPPCVPVLAYNAKGLVSLHVTWHTTCGREDFGPVRPILTSLCGRSICPPPPPPLPPLFSPGEEETQKDGARSGGSRGDTHPQAGLCVSVWA